MAPTLYMSPGSSPVRAVLMTAKSLELNLELKRLNRMKGEHKRPRFLKINPQQTVPTLVDDDGFTVWNSHAIMPYLVSKYGKNDSLYPRDLKKRAIIDQRMHFESEFVSPLRKRVFRSIIFCGKKTIDEKDRDAVLEIYDMVEVFLEGKEWIAGDCVTIADYSLIASITSLEVLVKIDSKEYPEMTAWLKRAEVLPVYDENKAGLKLFSVFVKSFLD